MEGIWVAFPESKECLSSQRLCALHNLNSDYQLDSQSLKYQYVLKKVSHRTWSLSADLWTRLQIIDFLLSLAVKKEYITVKLERSSKTVQDEMISWKLRSLYQPLWSPVKQLVLGHYKRMTWFSIAIEWRGSRYCGKNIYRNILPLLTHIT